MLIYLDNSATTRQYDEVTECMLSCMREEYGNPSSLHRMGMQTEKLVKEARKSVALGMGVAAEELCFTSGGTESDNAALMGMAEARKRRGNRIITTKVEHPAVLENCKRLEQQGFEVTYLPVDGQCRLDVSAVKEALTENTILISIMHVNNETGTIFPIEEIANLKEEYNKKTGAQVAFHTDCVQSFGKMKLALRQVDLASVSGHKLHGPKGIGALYIRNGLNPTVFMAGGGQEKNRRSGTENVPAIVGFGTAVQIACENLEQRMKQMEAVRAYLLEGICAEIPEVRINSPKETSLEGKAGFGCSSVLNVSFLGTRGEVILHTLEQDGIFVSTGSACSSNKKGQSHVLTAMKLPPKEIEGAIRFSFSEFNTMEEMDYVLEKLKTAVGKFRKLGSFR